MARSCGKRPATMCGAVRKSSCAAAAMAPSALKDRRPSEPELLTGADHSTACLPPAVSISSAARSAPTSAVASRRWPRQALAVRRPARGVGHAFDRQQLLDLALLRHEQHGGAGFGIGCDEGEAAAVGGKAGAVVAADGAGVVLVEHFAAGRVAHHHGGVRTARQAAGIVGLQRRHAVARAGQGQRVVVAQRLAFGPGKMAVARKLA